MAANLAFSKIAASGKKLHNLIVMHGLFGNKMNFRSLSKRPEMSGNADVYLLDLRNHGESFHSDSMTIAESSRDVIEFMDKLGLEKAVIFGHSLGGRIGMQVAFDIPDRVEGLVIGDVAPVDYSTYNLSNNDLIKFMDEMDLAGLGKKDAVKQKLQEFLQNKMTVVDFLMTNIIEDSQGRPRWRINLPVLRKDYIEYTGFVPRESARYLGPVSVIYGTQSEFMPPSCFPVFKKYFPNIDLQKDFKPIEAGHWIHFVDPELFLKYMAEFIKSLPPKK